MAEFTKETAATEFVYKRRELANGDSEYLRLPFNLVTYDDGQQYIEPINTVGLTSSTFGDVNPAATSGTFRIVDLEPFAELHAIR